MPSAPSTKSERTGEGVRVSLTGDWTVHAGRLAEAEANSIVLAADGAHRATIDLGGLGHLDTAGAWLIDRSRAQLATAGLEVAYARAQPEHNLLLDEAHFRTFEAPPRPHIPPLTLVLSDIGESVFISGRDLLEGLGFFGRVVTTTLWLAIHPERWRVTSTLFQFEAFGFRSVPIIVLINFLVGAIVAQQGIFQLQRFGAPTFAVDLIGILVLRELGVLITAIMIAGRSGSAITAEIGSMKMGEEIDALKVMALDPIEVLIVPRVIALVVALPMLTFLADLSALFGGLCVTWSYGGISPELYLERLQAAVDVSVFMIGITKAPFMALMIAIVASVEGFAVRGSAESLGSSVTNSVVKSIFMVIVLDGVFAMFFAAVRS